jgi:hypothetical protein
MVRIFERGRCERRCKREINKICIFESFRRHKRDCQEGEPSRAEV